MILRKMTKDKIECEHELFLNQSNSLSSGEQKELSGSFTPTVPICGTSALDSTEVSSCIH